MRGSIQPETLRRCLGRKHIEDGLAPRLLFAMPPTRPRRWTDAEVDHRVVSAVSSVFDHLLALEFGEDETGDPAPIDLPLSAQAKEVWVSFYNEHGAEMATLAGSDPAPARSKLEGYASRLGLVLHMARVVVGDADDSEVDEASITAGIKLARWFAHEARGVYTILGETDEDRRERRLIEFIRAKGGEVAARDPMRGGPSVKKADEAKDALDKLAEGGKGTRTSTAPTGRGGRPKDVFLLFNATDTDRTEGSPPHAGARRGFCQCQRSGAGRWPSPSAR